MESPLDGLSRMGLVTIADAESSKIVGGLVWPWQRSYWGMWRYILRRQR